MVYESWYGGVKKPKEYRVPVSCRHLRWSRNRAPVLHREFDDPKMLAVKTFHNFFALSQAGRDAQKCNAP